MILFIYRRVEQAQDIKNCFPEPNYCKIINLGYSVACVWCTHHEVQGMLPDKSSEDLEIKTLRSFSGSQTIFFSEHLSIGISGKGLITVELLVL